MKLQNERSDYPIMDGFLYNPRLRCNLTFLSLALEQYEALRRSTGMRTRVWCCPDDSNAIVCPANGSYEQQVYVKPGSAIWGYTFTGLSTGEGAEQGLLSVQVTDTCTDESFVSENVLTPAAGALSTLPGRGLQRPLSKLFIVGQPGLLNVVIASTYRENQHPQLLLYGGEPV